MPDDHSTPYEPEASSTRTGSATATRYVSSGIRALCGGIADSAAILLVCGEDRQEREELVGLWAEAKGHPWVVVDCSKAPPSPAAPSGGKAIKLYKDIELREVQAALKSDLAAKRHPDCLIAATMSPPPHSRGVDPDLWNLLAPYRVDVPPLRQRPGDIKDIARQVLEAHGHGVRFCTGVLELLALLPWPRHKTELIATVEFLASRVRALPGEITVERVASHLMRADCPMSGGKAAIPSDGWARVDHMLSLTRGHVDLVSHLTGLPRPTIEHRRHHHRTSREQAMRP
jgi:hypothetical protein